MKRRFVLLLICAVVLTLCACGSSSASTPVKEVEEKIAAIGEITKASETVIQDARDAYTALEEEAKNKVTNLELLEEAEKAYDQIVVEEVETLIDQIEIPQIGLPDENTEELVEEAKAAFDALTETQQKMVSNEQSLLYAEAVVNSPYGIPLYESVEDVDLNVVFAGHTMQRIVDLFGGYKEEIDHIQNSESIITEYYFLDNENWDEPQYVHYNYITHPNEPQYANYVDTYDLVVFNSDLYDDEPYTICLGETGNVNKFPMDKNTFTNSLKMPLCFSASPNIHITKAEETSDGYYLIYFDNKPIYTDCYVKIDPKTSLINEYGYHQEIGETVIDLSSVVSYGIDQLPDYSKVRSVLKSN